ncbi:hypothetical protein ACFC1T_09275 [Kitasatospora sp. NPDC056076]|uniref:hypothetical protein n=1 Tax=Kitasatospora sp. NPDC056076 TaxID=3345703 RepID=UPI0035DF8398
MDEQERERGRQRARDLAVERQRILGFAALWAREAERLSLKADLHRRAADRCLSEDKDAQHRAVADDLDERATDKMFWAQEAEQHAAGLAQEVLELTDRLGIVPVPAASGSGKRPAAARSARQHEPRGERTGTGTRVPTTAASGSPVYARAGSAAHHRAVAMVGSVLAP